ncbi:MAG TPA: Uma2 family endonuclease [Humisphaera sp.]
MTMLAPPHVTPPAGAPPDLLPPGAALLEGVSWETYERLREETDAAGQALHITYDRGTMLLMPPLPDHETWKKLTGRMVEMIAIDLRIPMRALGGATWRRRDQAGGLEADECYYVQNERAVRGKRTIDLASDPPPDLAFESENTHAALDKLAVYARLGVPEVWRYDGARLSAVLLEEAGGRREYVPTETSRAFPFLRPADLEPFLSRVFDVDETSLLLEFRDWVAATLKPKV